MGHRQSHACDADHIERECATKLQQHVTTIAKLRSQIYARQLEYDHNMYELRALRRQFDRLEAYEKAYLNSHIAPSPSDGGGTVPHSAGMLEYNPNTTQQRRAERETLLDALTLCIDKNGNSIRTIFTELRRFRHTARPPIPHDTLPKNAILQVLLRSVSTKSKEGRAVFRRMRTVDASTRHADRHEETKHEHEPEANAQEPPVEADATPTLLDLQRRLDRLLVDLTQTHIENRDSLNAFVSVDIARGVPAMVTSRPFQAEGDLLVRNFDKMSVLCRRIRALLRRIEKTFKPATRDATTPTLYNVRQGHHGDAYAAVGPHGAESRPALPMAVPPLLLRGGGA